MSLRERARLLFELLEERVEGIRGKLHVGTEVDHVTVESDDVPLVPIEALDSDPG